MLLRHVARSLKMSMTTVGPWGDLLTPSTVRPEGMGSSSTLELPFKTRMTCFAGPCSEGAGDAAGALAALKAAVQAIGAAARPSPAASAKATGRGRGAGSRKGLRSSGGVAVVVLDEMDQLLAGDTSVLTELFLLPKVRPWGCGLWALSALGV